MTVRDEQARKPDFDHVLVILEPVRDMTSEAVWTGYLDSPDRWRRPFSSLEALLGAVAVLLHKLVRYEERVRSGAKPGPGHGNPNYTAGRPPAVPNVDARWLVRFTADLQQDDPEWRADLVNDEAWSAGDFDLRVVMSRLARRIHDEVDRAPLRDISRRPGRPSGSRVREVGRPLVLSGEEPCEPGGSAPEQESSATGMAGTRTGDRLNLAEPPYLTFDEMAELGRKEAMVASDKPEPAAPAVSASTVSPFEEQLTDQVDALKAEIDELKERRRVSWADASSRLVVLEREYRGSVAARSAYRDKTRHRKGEGTDEVST